MLLLLLPLGQAALHGFMPLLPRSFFCQLARPATPYQGWCWQA